MKRFTLYALISVLFSSVGYGTIWIESFDTGVGRLDQTTGNGETKYVWNQTEECIDAEFVRYPHENFTIDTRYANLGTVYNVHDNVLGFSAVFTPTSKTSTYYGKSANIGFIGDASTGLANMITVGFVNRQSGLVTAPRAFRIAINYDDARPHSEEYLNFSWGTQYFIDFLVDGGNHIASASLYEGIDQDGVYVGTISMTLDPTKNLDVYGLGLINGSGVTISQTSPYKTWGELDEISLTVVPEATTLSLLALGAIALLRKRRA